MKVRQHWPMGCEKKVSQCPVCPRDKPSLSLGQSRGRKAAEKVKETPAAKLSQSGYGGALRVVRRSGAKVQKMSLAQVQTPGGAGADLFYTGARDLFADSRT